MTQVLDIGILGGDGRMGGAIIRALAAEPQARLCAAVTASTADTIGRDAGELAGLKACGVTLISDIHIALEACDVLIDFSSPKAAIDAALAMPKTRCHTLVTGTTGYTAAQEAALLAAAEHITLLKSGNFSVGVTLLEALVELAAAKLRTGWDVEILDMHHRHKVDAPSGTALMLGEAAAKGRGIKLGDNQSLSRQGRCDGRGDARRDGEIGFAALRGGGVIGAHEVRIAHELEMITLKHDAFDRSVFASGAITAALWAASQPTGLYDMTDVLGL